MRSDDSTSGFFVDLYMSGTTFFTLGLGDVTPVARRARAITVSRRGSASASSRS